MSARPVMVSIHHHKVSARIRHLLDGEFDRIVQIKSKVITGPRALLGRNVFTMLTPDQAEDLGRYLIAYAEVARGLDREEKGS